MWKHLMTFDPLKIKTACSRLEIHSETLSQKTGCCSQLHALQTVSSSETPGCAGVKGSRGRRVVEVLSCACLCKNAARLQSKSPASLFSLIRMFQRFCSFNFKKTVGSFLLLRHLHFRTDVCSPGSKTGLVNVSVTVHF